MCVCASVSVRHKRPADVIELVPLSMDAAAVCVVRTDPLRTLSPPPLQDSPSPPPGGCEECEQVMDLSLNVWSRAGTRPRGRGGEGGPR